MRHEDWCLTERGGVCNCRTQANSGLVAAVEIDCGIGVAFDPEKVERLHVADAYTMCPANDPAFPVYVDAADYDKLLELYHHTAWLLLEYKKAVDFIGLKPYKVDGIQA